MTPPRPSRCQSLRWRSPNTLLILLLLLARAIFGASLTAQNHPSEDDVKAAYLFNFGKFVRHSGSASPSLTFDLCLLGHDDINPILTAIAANEKIDNRAVLVKQYERAADARSCAIVFLGAAESSRVDKDLAALQGSNVLTVSDIPHFLDRGGMIQFVLQNNRVRFSVNLEAVHRTSLQLSSELLKVAASVTGAPAPEAAP